MRPEPFVSIQGVSKSYPTRHGPVSAIDNVSLGLGCGDFVAVLGPSGCGKTTLMLMVAGLLSHGTGTISVNGARVNGPRTDVGIVFQDAVLLDWRSVIGNLMLQAEIRNLDRASIRARGMELLAQAGLEGFEHRYPWELSGGMRQRVSLCRALVHDPALLLMDEPFGALDALTRDQLNLDLQDIWSSRRTAVMFITHSISEAVFLANRVIVMSPRPGHIVAQIDINLPRPRHLRIRETFEFGRYMRETQALFEQLGVLRERRGTGSGRA